MESWFVWMFINYPLHGRSNKDIIKGHFSNIEEVLNGLQSNDELTSSEMEDMIREMWVRNGLMHRKTNNGTLFLYFFNIKNNTPSVNL